MRRCARPRRCPGGRHRLVLKRQLGRRARRTTVRGESSSSFKVSGVRDRRVPTPVPEREQVGHEDNHPSEFALAPEV